MIAVGEGPPPSRKPFLRVVVVFGVEGCRCFTGLVGAAAVAPLCCFAIIEAVALEVEIEGAAAAIISSRSVRALETGAITAASALVGASSQPSI